jgi:hypothetical protein
MPDRCASILDSRGAAINHRFEGLKRSSMIKIDPYEAIEPLLQSLQVVSPIQTLEGTNRVIVEFEAAESGHGIGKWRSAREQLRRNSVERDDSGSRNLFLLHKLFAENKEGLEDLTIDGRESIAPMTRRNEKSEG